MTKADILVTAIVCFICGMVSGLGLALTVMG